MRVIFLLSSPRGAFGGIETIAENLACALAARGHTLSFVYGGQPPRLDTRTPANGAVELTPLPHSSPVARFVARLIRTSPLNVQSLVFFARFLDSPRARRLAAHADVGVTFFEGEAVLFSRYFSRRGVGTVYYYHGGVDPRWAVRDRSTRRVAISHTIAAHSAERHGYLCQGIVWPGISSDWLSRPCAADRGEQPRRLVYTGRLEHIPKRPDRLLACFAALAPEFPELTLRFVGDGSMRRELEESSARAGLADRVVFTGAQSPAGVRDELRQADLFLFPSTYESFGLSVVEAMAAGVPVVAGDLPALREATGGQACLLPGEDLAAWVEATRTLLRDAALRRERSRAGRVWAAQFTWERAAARMERHLVAARQRAMEGEA